MIPEPTIRDLRIFDSHGHCGPFKRQAMYRDGSADSMIEVMDRCGIERVVCSWMRALNYDVEAGNAEMLEGIRRYSGRFYGYIVAHPDAAQKTQLDELEKYRDVPGVLGVKIHPGMHGVRPIDTGYDQVYAWCSEHEYPLLSHTWGEADIEDFRAVLGRHTNLKVILGHSGGPSGRALSRARALAAEKNGVYLDITCSRANPGLVEWMIEGAPEERVLFGSDMPFIDPRPTIGLVYYARISDRLREAVFRTNAERLFEARL